MANTFVSNMNTEGRNILTSSIFKITIIFGKNPSKGGVPAILNKTTIKLKCKILFDLKILSVWKI